jgi:hypothetical protein
MSQYKYKPTVVTASGTWTGDTMRIFNGICCQLYAKAVSTDTTFDITVTDSDQIEVRKATGVNQTLNDLTKWPVEGVYTVLIDNASADEVFTVLLAVEEF